MCFQCSFSRPMRILYMVKADWVLEIEIGIVWKSWDDLSGSVSTCNFISPNTMKTSLKEGKNIEVRDVYSFKLQRECGNWQPWSRPHGFIIFYSALPRWSLPSLLLSPSCLSLFARPFGLPSTPATFPSSSDIYKSDSSNGSGAAGFCKQTVDGLGGKKCLGMLRLGYLSKPTAPWSICSDVI